MQAEQAAHCVASGPGAGIKRPVRRCTWPCLMADMPSYLPLRAACCLKRRRARCRGKRRRQWVCARLPGSIEHHAKMSNVACASIRSSPSSCFSARLWPQSHHPAEQATAVLSLGSAAVCLWIAGFQIAECCSSEIGQLPSSAGGTRQISAHAWHCQAAVCAL